MWYNDFIGLRKFNICGCGGIGRRARFRFWWHPRAGSSPVTRTSHSADGAMPVITLWWRVVLCRRANIYFIVITHNKQLCLFLYMKLLELYLIWFNVFLYLLITMEYTLTNTVITIFLI